MRSCDCNSDHETYASVKLGAWLCELLQTREVVCSQQAFVLYRRKTQRFAQGKVTIECQQQRSQPLEVHVGSGTAEGKRRHYVRRNDNTVYQKCFQSYKELS